MYMFVVVIIMSLIIILSNMKNPGSKAVKGKVIGFEASPYPWYPRISPILSYVIDGKEYRCVMFLLQCEDNTQNRLLNINKEYTLYYDEKYPNRVKTNNINNKNILIAVIMLFWMFFLFFMIKGL